MASTLPTLVVILGGNGYYLGCMPDGRLKYSAGALEPAVKFAVEPAASKGNEGYVHIRSCYNNKYWVKSSGSDDWIVAGATKPNEDTTSWNCTLFLPEVLLQKEENEVKSKHVEVKFKHVHLQDMVGVSAANEYVLSKSAHVQGEPFASKVADYSDFVVLPKIVSFKADNGKYFQLHGQDGEQYLSATEDNSNYNTVPTETFANVDGNYKFKNVASGKYWRSNTHWVWVDGKDESFDNKNTVFAPVKIGDNAVALRCLGDNFVKRLGEFEGKYDCMRTTEPSITSQCYFTVDEPVISRDIRVNRFRVEDAQIYDEKAVEMDSQSSCNYTDYEDQATLTFRYNELKSRSWSNSTTVSMGINFSFSSGIPEVFDTGIEISEEFSESYSWGETKDESKEIEASQQATVPPQAQIKVTLVATQAKCDIPFTYEQTDILYDGRRVTNTFDDGVYNGVNQFNFTYEIHQLPLPVK